MSDIKECVGDISISRCSGTRGHVCRIEINDGMSGCRVLDLEMTFEALGNAITGLASQPAKFRVFENDNIGKRHEHKHEKVMVKGGAHRIWTKNEENIRMIRDAVQAFEVDGWHARVDDAFNCHLHCQTIGEDVLLSIGFDRWVEVSK